ncbi:hypothetical protein F5148DRAFT_1163956 [Russula earlei]|uniref:Uncharacterized protein n=1 Tax=Russula earlei TaxID=71964 RepID=A0ACC0UKQ6_9AGAM|nr:hypothetical protein F5148DRAFT_1163956 [Russula earlei]
MARGNQRDLAREKAQKKAAASNKSKPKEGKTTSLAQRRAKNTEAIQAKQKQSMDKAAATGTAKTGGSGGGK